MPGFDHTLHGQAQSAIAIVRAGEITHVSSEATIRREWSVTRLEALYELAYLRVFAAWEVCLESVFYRSLCGYASSAGQETLVTGNYYPSLASAEAAVLGGRSYKLWHNPQHVIDRCRGFIKSGVGCPCLQESVLSSNFAYLVDLGNTRHRIVHDSNDAKRKFDTATLQIAGRTYASSRPGRFLRDWDTSTLPSRRRLEVAIVDLVAIIGQIV